MGAKDFDGLVERLEDELRERLSQDAYKELVPTLQCIARPNFRWKVERESEENKAKQIWVFCYVVIDLTNEDSSSDDEELQ